MYETVYRCRKQLEDMYETVYRCRKQLVICMKLFTGVENNL